MSHFSVNIDTGNNAFDNDNENAELARILREIAGKIEADGCSGFFETIRDLNGNDVGRFALKPGHWPSKD